MQLAGVSTNKRRVECSQYRMPIVRLITGISKRSLAVTWPEIFSGGVERRSTEEAEIERRRRENRGAECWRLRVFGFLILKW